MKLTMCLEILLKMILKENKFWRLSWLWTMKKYC